MVVSWLCGLVLFDCCALGILAPSAWFAARRFESPLFARGQPRPPGATQARGQRASTPKYAFLHAGRPPCDRIGLVPDGGCEYGQWASICLRADLHLAIARSRRLLRVGPPDRGQNSIARCLVRPVISLRVPPAVRVRATYLWPATAVVACGLDLWRRIDSEMIYLCPLGCLLGGLSWARAGGVCSWRAFVGCRLAAQGCVAF